MSITSAKTYFNDYKWNVIPLPEGTKHPKKGFDLKRVLYFPESKEDFKTYFPDDKGNIAVAGGIHNATTRNKQYLNIIDIEACYLNKYQDLIVNNPLFKRLNETTRISQTTSNGRHIFFNTEKPLHSLSVTDNKTTILEFKAFGNYVMVPPSIVSNPYLWENPEQKNVITLPIEYVKDIFRLWNKDIREVTTEEYIETLSTYQNERQLRGISDDINRKYWNYLKYGTWNQNYHLTKTGDINRSEIEFSIIYRLVSLGFSSATIESFFDMYAFSGSKSKTQKVAYFRRSIEKAIQYYKKNKSDFDKQCDEILNKVPYLELSSYEKTVLLAILSICKSIGRFDDVALPQNVIAKHVGIGQKSVSRNIKKLLEHGILKLVSQNNVTGNVYSLIIKKETNSYTFSLVEGYSHFLNYSNTDSIKGIDIDSSYAKFRELNKDEFFYHGFNKTGFYIVHLLNSNIRRRFDAKEISQLLNISIPTVNKKLSELVKYNYVEIDKKPTGKRPKKIYWVDTSIENLTALALDKKVIGKSFAHKAQIENEQKGYREFLENETINITPIEKTSA